MPFQEKHTDNLRKHIIIMRARTKCMKYMKCVTSGSEQGRPQRNAARHLNHLSLAAMADRIISQRVRRASLSLNSPAIFRKRKAKRNKKKTAPVRLLSVNHFEGLAQNARYLSAYLSDTESGEDSEASAIFSTLAFRERCHPLAGNAAFP